MDEPADQRFFCELFGPRSGPPLTKFPIKQRFKWRLIVDAKIPIKQLGFRLHAAEKPADQRLHEACAALASPHEAYSALDLAKQL
eukprot:454164-Heterocapsa_arctica.AAC.1